MTFYEFIEKFSIAVSVYLDKLINAGVVNAAIDTITEGFDKFSTIIKDAIWLTNH